MWTVNRVFKKEVCIDGQGFFFFFLLWTVNRLMCENFVNWTFCVKSWTCYQRLEHFAWSLEHFVKKLFSLILFFLAFFLLGTSADDVTSVISSSLFDQMLKYRNDSRSESNGFYTYNAFVDAAKSFNGFGTTGDITTRKRELAAFFGQTSHETTG